MDEYIFLNEIEKEIADTMENYNVDRENAIEIIKKNNNE